MEKLAAVRIVVRPGFDDSVRTIFQPFVPPVEILLVVCVVGCGFDPWVHTEDHAQEVDTA